MELESLVYFNTGISLANELIKDNQRILNESCIKSSLDKERIKINF